VNVSLLQRCVPCSLSGLSLIILNEGRVIRHANVLD
jgi:hypothetical protein